MPSPSLSPTYILAAVAAVVSLFVTQNVISNATGQLVSGLASVLVPLAVVIAESILKGHQAQAKAHVQAAHVHADAVRSTHAPRARAAK